MLYSDASGHISANPPQISILDHGFLFGDSLYEALRVYKRKIFAWKEHSERFIICGERVGINIKALLPEIEKRTKSLLAELNEPEAGVRIIVTRGVGKLNIDWRSCSEPAIYIAAWKFDHAGFSKPVSLYISKIRRNSRLALDPAVKSGNYLNNVLAFKEAVEAGYDDAIMLNSDGHITELTTSNLGWIKNGIFYTSQTDSGILHGVTRRLLLQIEKVKEGSFTEEDLFEADELFVLSTFKEVLPVSRLGSYSGATRAYTRTDLSLSLRQRMREHIEERLKSERESF